MDPKSTLKIADEAIEDNDIDLATESLEAYAEWRAKGGFEPWMYPGIGGDFIWSCILHKYELMWGEYRGRRLD